MACGFLLHHADGFEVAVGLTIAAGLLLLRFAATSVDLHAVQFGAALGLITEELGSGSAVSRASQRSRTCTAHGRDQ